VNLCAWLPTHSGVRLLVIFIIRNQEDEVLLEVPLTAGVAVGGVMTLIAPVLAALGAMAALLTHVKVEIVRTEPVAEGPPDPQER
jgi:hypothetical protein